VGGVGSDGALPAAVSLSTEDWVELSDRSAPKSGLTSMVAEIAASAWRKIVEGGAAEERQSRRSRQ
jgi:hypothetical protein